jgi:hypothetical protein
VVLLEESKKGGKAFTIEQLAEWAPPVAAGTESALRSDTRYPSVDMNLIRAANTYDELPAALRNKFEALCAADPVVRGLWDGKPAPRQDDESGSGYAFALARQLKAAVNFTVNEFGQLLWVYPDASDRSKIDARYIVRAWDNSPTPWEKPQNLWADMTDPPALPTGLLPDLVERLARDKARRLGVEPGAVAASLVASLGSLVPAPNKLQMRQNDTGWTLHPVLWVAIVGDPGTNKSATVGYAIEPVEHVEKSWRRMAASDWYREAEQAAARIEAVIDWVARPRLCRHAPTGLTGAPICLGSRRRRRTVGHRTRLARPFQCSRALAIHAPLRHHRRRRAAELARASRAAKPDGGARWRK